MNIKAVNPGINWLGRRARANIGTSPLSSQIIAIHTSTQSVQATVPTRGVERHDASSQRQIPHIPQRSKIHKQKTLRGGHIFCESEGR